MAVAFWGCSIHLYCTSLSGTGECGSVVSGQLNNIRTDVMSGSQSVIIKMLTGYKQVYILLFSMCNNMQYALYKCTCTYLVKDM